MNMLTPVELTDRAVRLIDQRKLPLTEVWLECESPEATAAAITDMVVRGAPALQWVRTVASSGTSCAPWRPIARQDARSSS